MLPSLQLEEPVVNAAVALRALEVEPVDHQSSQQSAKDVSPKFRSRRDAGSTA
jgi:hypothetical protein